MSNTTETPTTTTAKTDTTPSLSGKSKITYTLGSDQGDALSIQLTANTGAGHFSPEWIAYSAIQEVLPDTSFTSVVLRPLFKNRSLNSSGFLLAALLNEGLVVRVPGSRRKFVRALNIEKPKTPSMSTAKTAKTPAKKSLFDPTNLSPDDTVSTVSTPDTPAKSPRKKPSRAKSAPA